MTSYLTLDDFDKIYNDTYEDVLKYVICKCNDINDANDIIQEVYLELWKILNKKDLQDINIKSYILSISNHKIKKHYSLLKRLNFFKSAKDIENNVFVSSENIEKLVIDDDTWYNIWSFIKSKKNKDIPKIFYLYYRENLTIKQISDALNVNTSYIKNLIYRTLKELKLIFERDSD